MTDTTRMTTDESRGDSVRFCLLTIALGTVLLTWVGHAVGQMRGWWDVPFWKIWEVSSVFVSLIVTVVFWFTYIVGREDKEAGLQGGRAIDLGTWVLALIVFSVGFGFAGVAAWMEWPVAAHVGLLVLGVLSTIVLARCEMRALHAALNELGGKLKQCNAQSDYDNNTVIHKENIIKRARHKIGDRDNVTKFLCFSDAPIAFAMIVLAGFAVFYDVCGFDRILAEVRALPAFGGDHHIPHGTIAVTEHRMGLEQLRAAIAGAVALQLLYSNIVYWLEACADTQWGKDRLERLAPALQPIRVMLRPHELWSDKDIETELNTIAKNCPLGDRSKIT